MSKEKCVLAYSGGLDTSALDPVHEGEVRLRHHRRAGRRGPDEGRRRAAPAGPHGGRGRVDGHRRQGGVPARLRLPGPEGQRSLRGQVPAALGAVAAADRQEDGRGGPASTARRSCAHGCTAKGNDQVRIDVSVRCLDPSITVLGPAREWNMTRPELLDYLAARGIDLPLTKKNPYSIDENLWGRAIECGELEDPWTAAPLRPSSSRSTPTRLPTSRRKWWSASRRASRCRSTARRMDPIELVETMDEIGGSARLRPHRHGREPPGGHQEPRGLRSRRLAVADHGPSRDRRPDPHPGAAALQERHRPAHDRAHLRRPVVQPLGECLRAFIDESQKSRHRRGPAALLQGLLPAGRPALAQLALRWQVWPPTARATPSATSRPWASSSCGACRWRSGRASARPSCERRSSIKRRQRQKPWGGRFEAEQAPLFERLNASIPFDNVLAPFDIRGSQAHVRMLASHRRADRRGARPDPGRPGRDRSRRSTTGTFTWTLSDEDIHMAIERRLTEIDRAAWAARCTPGAAATTR